MDAIIRKTHQTIQKVTEDIDKRFRFNTAIAAMMELVNEIYKAKETAKSDDELAVLKESSKYLLVMLSPFIPHFSDELWEQLGNEGVLLDHPWPEFNPDFIETNEATVAIQINGKLRGTVKVAMGSSQEDVYAKAIEEVGVKKFIGPSGAKKVIYVPNKIINIIA